MRAEPFLLFDLGGVLIENVGFERIKYLMPEVAPTDVLKERWLASPHVRAFELGKIDAQAFSVALVDEYGLNCSPQHFLAEFVTWPRGFYERALDLLHALRARHRIGCLTNSNVLHWERFGGFADLFDVALSSHRSGMIKPDRACFDHAIVACGVPADQILFFDDAIPNVMGARHAGLRAIHTCGLDEVREALRVEGLIR